jgi:hypothetical protein
VRPGNSQEFSIDLAGVLCACFSSRGPVVSWNLGVGGLEWKRIKSGGGPGNSGVLLTMRVPSLQVSV